jgi:hypothetical protein
MALNVTPMKILVGRRATHCYLNELSLKLMVFELVLLKSQCGIGTYSTASVQFAKVELDQVPPFTAFFVESRGNFPTSFRRYDQFETGIHNHRKQCVTECRRLR